MASGFRIESVAIEGFKGFTIRQVINFKRRHAFLLGKNGNGKSSIVEAIRWGLFGSTGRRNEIVTNRDYPGQCRVEITLMRDGKRRVLRRTVLRGITGGNDAVLVDEQGKELSLREEMPQLDSVDAGEGMHIIFAPQAAPLRRQPEDLSAFERTMLNHLGLTHPRSLLSLVDRFLEDQQLQEDNLGRHLDVVRDEVDKKVAYCERQRGIILSSPPWDGGQAPSMAETENKVRALIMDITGQPPDASLSGISLDALIDNAEDALRDRQAQGQGALEQELEAIVKRKDLLLAFRLALEAVEAKQSTIRANELRLEGILAGVSFEEFRQSVERQREAADAVALRLRMVKDATLLLQRDEVDPVQCPVCAVEHGRHDLESALDLVVGQQSDGHSEELSQLEARLSDAESLSQDLERLNTELVGLRQTADDEKTRIDAEDANQLPTQGSPHDLDTIIKRHEDRETAIRTQLDNQKEWFDSTQARLSKLKEEENFHRIQKDLVRLGQSRNQLKQVKAAYQDLVSFGETVRAIRTTIAGCLNERLEQDLPEVSEKLSQVFNALTRHPWYDRLTIAKDNLPKLELRVTSSQDTSGRSHSAEVLNGQAERALALVPYFAFSQADDAPTEVYLVLLDDPTQAFDEDHIDILAERLSELGHHVQLMVASQESGRFRALLPRYFKPASYLIVEPADWSHDAGPELSIEYA